MDPAAGIEAGTSASPAARLLQRALLFVVSASSAIVLIEPSPYEVLTLGVMTVFVLSGLRLRAGLMPLAVLLTLLNAGYGFSASGLYDDSRVALWVASSCFLGVTAVFFAAVMAEDTEARLSAIGSGFIAGGAVATLAGLVGYFHLAGADLFTLYGRMKGTFKDPNVFGTFLIFPALASLQRLVTGDAKAMLRHGPVLALLGIGLLLSFSRASWGLGAGCGVAMLAALYATSRAPAERLKIVALAGMVAVVLALAVVALLSVDQVANLFHERARLDQDYDSGRVGRFGRHLLGADMALSAPMGIGPLQFSHFFPEDPHNSYLNAFMSGGWLSGVLYFALTAATLMAAWRVVRRSAPWRPAAMPVVATTVGIALQSAIIDTDHWRHYFVLIGLCWGLATAPLARRADKA